MLWEMGCTNSMLLVFTVSYAVNFSGMFLRNYSYTSLYFFDETLAYVGI